MWVNDAYLLQVMQRHVAKRCIDAIIKVGIYLALSINNVPVLICSIQY